MASDYAVRRRAAIEQAARDVLAEKGYKAASMLEIAKRAGASNQTLYKWYGNKQGLFRALVDANAAHVVEMFEKSLAASNDVDDVFAALDEIGPALLALVTGERAIALNRAAAGDVHDTATLGAALAQGGRDRVVPLVAALFEHAAEKGEMRFVSKEDAAEIYIALLIGDLQVRRVTGALPPLTAEQMAQRSKWAIALLRKLMGSSPSERPIKP